LEDKRNVPGALDVDYRFYRGTPLAEDGDGDGDGEQLVIPP